MDEATFNEMIMHTHGVIPVYDFEQSMALFSAIYLATLKRWDDQASNKKIDNMNRRRSSLCNAVYKMVEPFLSTDKVTDCNSLDLLKEWCLHTLENVRIYAYDVNTQLLYPFYIFSSTPNENCIQLLRTTNEINDVYYHVLVNKEVLIKKIEEHVSPATPRVKLLNRSYAKQVSDSLKAKQKAENKARALYDLEHIHVNLLLTWSQLTKRDKKHLMLCNECSEPFFNDTPNGKIRSILQYGPNAGDVYSTPYKALYLMRDDMIYRDDLKSPHQAYIEK